jgi:hypothetical protein
VLALLQTLQRAVVRAEGRGWWVVVVPATRYIEIGQYDPARTNINYCTKVDG